MASPVPCPACAYPLPWQGVNAGGLGRCPRCRRGVRAWGFPALIRPQAPAEAGAPVVAGDEASCFYHPQKRASVVCQACGRFVCSLCDLELDGGHLCPVCVDTGRRRGRIRDLEHRRVLYDSLALFLATVPLLLWPFTLFTAPAALFVVVRYWRAPRSLLGRTRVREVAAALLASAQVVGWGVLLYLGLS